MSGERAQFGIIKTDVETAYGVRNGAPSWLEQAAWDIDAGALQEDPIEDPTARVRRGMRPPIIGSRGKSSSLKFSTHLVGLQTAAGDAVLAARTFIGELLLNLYGTEVVSTGTKVVNAGSTVAIINVSVGDGAGLALNTVIGFTVGTAPNTHIEWRTIKLIATDAITPDYELSAVPNEDAVVYATASYQFTDQTVEANALSLQVLNDTDADATSPSQFECYGCFVNSMTVSKLAPTDQAVCSWDLLMATWIDDEAVITDNMAELTTIPAKYPWMGARYELVAWGASAPTTTYAAGNLRRPYEVEVAHSQELTARPAPEAGQGIGMYDAGAGSPISISMTLPIDDEWRDAFTNQTPYMLQAPMGGVAGKAPGFWFRKIVQVEPPGISEVNGQMVATTTWGLDASGAEPAAIAYMG